VETTLRNTKPSHTLRSYYQLGEATTRHDALSPPAFSHAAPVTTEKRTLQIEQRAQQPTPHQTMGTYLRVFHTQHRAPENQPLTPSMELMEQVL